MPYFIIDFLGPHGFLIFFLSTALSDSFFHAESKMTEKIDSDQFPGYYTQGENWFSAAQYHYRHDVNLLKKSTQ